MVLRNPIQPAHHKAVNARQCAQRYEEPTDHLSCNRLRQKHFKACQNAAMDRTALDTGNSIPVPSDSPKSAATSPQQPATSNQPPTTADNKNKPCHPAAPPPSGYSQAWPSLSPPSPSTPATPSCSYAACDACKPKPSIATAPIPYSCCASRTISIRLPGPGATCGNKGSHIRSPPGNHNSSESAATWMMHLRARKKSRPPPPISAAIWRFP